MRKETTTGGDEVTDRPVADNASAEPPASADVPAPTAYRSPGVRRFARRFWSSKLAVAALIVLLIIIIISMASPLLAPYKPGDIDVVNRLSGSTPQHWLGTDSLGRDTLSRLMYGGRTSLASTGMAVGIAIAIGVPLGLTAGYLGGKTDWLLGRAADVLMTFPGIVLTIAVIAATGPGLVPAMTTLGVVYSPRLFRIVRSATLSVREETYIEASISIGTPAMKIIRKRILPNILSPLLVQISLLLAAALLAAAALSLLGLGVVPPTPSWGNILGRGFVDIRTTPTLVIYPGALIAIASIAFNLIGDGLRDSLGRETRKGDK